MQHWWNDTKRRQSSTRRDTTSLSLCLPQIRHELAWDWTPASTVRGPSLLSRRSLVFYHGWPHMKFVMDLTALEQDFSLVSSVSSRSLYSATDPYSSIVTTLSCMFKLISLDSVISLVTKWRVGWSWFDSRKRQEIFIFCKIIQTGSGVHSASYLIGTVFCPGGKVTGAWS